MQLVQKFCRIQCKFNHWWPHGPIRCMPSMSLPLRSLWSTLSSPDFCLLQLIFIIASTVGLFQGCCNTFAWNTVSAFQTWKSWVYLINMRSQLSLLLLFLSCCSCICRCSLLPGPSTVHYTPLGVFHYINPLPQIFFLLKNKPSCKLSNRSDADILAAYCLRDHHKSDNLQ